MVLQHKDIKLISYNEEINNTSLRNLYYKWLKDKNITRFFGQHKFDNYETKDELINASFERMTKDDCQGFFINKNERYLGTVKLGIDFRNKRCEVGIMIGEADVWGKGIGTMAIKLALRYAFVNLKMHCVCGGTLEINKRMQRVFDKIGFKHDGLLRDVIIIDDKFVSNHRYSMLECEYNMCESALLR